MRVIETALDFNPLAPDMRTLLAVLLTIVVCQSAGYSRALEGGVQLDSIQPDDGDSDTTLQSQTAKLESFSEHPPTWINGKVFSHDDMVMYSFWQIHPFKKEFRWTLPDRRISTIRLKPNVIQHWKGYKPDGSCPVICLPMGAGKFRFHHKRADGPSGYLERVGVNKQGFPRYRFWFRDREPLEQKQSDSDTSTATTGSQ